MSRMRAIAAVLTAILTIASSVTADVIDQHPAADVLQRVLAGSAPARPTGLNRADYLKLIAGEIDFWRQHQDSAGAIIDPYEKKERQYSTPAFAHAAALLVQESGRKDLIEPASKALTFSITALAKRTTADSHADFYIPMVIHARRLLRPHVTRHQLLEWDTMLIALDPEKTYRDVKANANWNVVNVCGECLRRKDNLVSEDLLTAQQEYLERCFERQMRRFTKFGMYEDPNGPLAYDAFPRLWLEDVLAEGAYEGKQKARLEENLLLGGLSTLLLLSPQGEWACGGRSAHHQWNEAEIAVICEINARKWKSMGRDDIAGAFKRGAHLALSSMRQWVRPTGEMWIVKNHADPSQRFGYEGYSFHSQYNLLPMAMLAIAYERADESIVERTIPAETQAYVFDLRDTYHKVVAAAGGMYVLIDTSADSHYNATGLQRIHRVGIPLSPLSDSTAGQRNYGPLNNKTKVAMTPGIQWKEGENWQSLADYSMGKAGAPLTVRQADLAVNEQGANRAGFTIRYNLGDRTVEEKYLVSQAGVEMTSTLDGGSPARIRFPVLVSDGANETQVAVQGSKAEVKCAGAILRYQMIEPSNVALALEGERVPCHNGYMKAAVADLPEGIKAVRWRITLDGGQE